ncbi:hypothetical protein L904_04825 [Agrobacterium sp. LY4]|nr:hypothetical protein L904_04825 [Agrobacterium sp. LY4]
MPVESISAARPPTVVAFKAVFSEAVFSEERPFCE